MQQKTFRNMTKGDIYLLMFKVVLFQQRAAVIEAWQSQGGVLLMVLVHISMLSA